MSGWDKPSRPTWDPQDGPADGTQAFPADGTDDRWSQPAGSGWGGSGAADGQDLGRGDFGPPDFGGQDLGSADFGRPDYDRADRREPAFPPEQNDFIPVNTVHQVIVARGNSISVPLPVTIAAASPAFSYDGTGKGQGIIVGIDPATGAQTYADAAHPVRAGQSIVIDRTGLGEVYLPGDRRHRSPGSGFHRPSIRQRLPSEGFPPQSASRD